MGFFEKLGFGLKKTRKASFESITELMDSPKITEELYEELTERLILAHLSQHNNTPDLAYELCYEELLKAGFWPGEDVSLAMMPTELPDCIYKAGE